MKYIKINTIKTRKTIKTKNTRKTRKTKNNTKTIKGGIPTKLRPEGNFRNISTHVKSALDSDSKEKEDFCVDYKDIKDRLVHNATNEHILKKQTRTKPLAVIFIKQYLYNVLTDITNKYKNNKNFIASFNLFSKYTGYDIIKPDEFKKLDIIQQIKYVSILCNLVNRFNERISVQDFKETTLLPLRREYLEQLKNKIIN
jgi:hypothetical protein